MIDALDFAAYTVTDVLPYTVRELVAIAISNPVLLALALFFLWSLYVVIGAILRHIRVVVLIGASYALVLVLQRYLAAR